MPSANPVGLNFWWLMTPSCHFIVSAKDLSRLPICIFASHSLLSATVSDMQISSPCLSFVFHPLPGFAVVGIGPRSPCLLCKAVQLSLGCGFFSFPSPIFLLTYLFIYTIYLSILFCDMKIDIDWLSSVTPSLLLEGQIPLGHSILWSLQTIGFNLLKF